MSLLLLASFLLPSLDLLTNVPLHSNLPHSAGHNTARLLGCCLHRPTAPRGDSKIFYCGIIEKGWGSFRQFRPRAISDAHKTSKRKLSVH